MSSRVDQDKQEGRGIVPNFSQPLKASIGCSVNRSSLA